MTFRRGAIVIFILFLSLFLHLHNYQHYPQRGASSDEYTYSFMGLSLLTKGVPSSWSNFTPYLKTKHYDLTINHLYFWIVEPYFDHPPLNGVLVGGFALMRGENTFEKIQLSTIRLVPIFLSVITTYLIFYLGFTLFGYSAGLWSMLIYATSTIMVLNTRVVFAENLLTPLFLAALILYRKRLTAKTTIILGVIAGLCIWTKEAGITVFSALFVLSIADRQKWQTIFILSTMTILAALLYVAYGVYYNATLFWQILSLQSSRIIGPDTLHLLLTKPIIVNKVFYDGWYLFGFIALFWTLLNIKRYKLVALPAMIYLLFQLVGINREGEMGWYMIPMFPFFSLAVGILASEYLVKRNLLTVLLSLFVGLSYILNSFEPAFGLSPAMYRILFSLLLFPPLVTYLFANDRWMSRFNRMWLVLLIALGAIQTYLYVHPA